MNQYVAYEEFLLNAVGEFRKYDFWCIDEIVCISITTFKNVERMAILNYSEVEIFVCELNFTEFSSNHVQTIHCWLNAVVRAVFRLVQHIVLCCQLQAIRRMWAKRGNYTSGFIFTSDWEAILFCVSRQSVQLSHPSSGFNKQEYSILSFYYFAHFSPILFAT